MYTWTTIYFRNNMTQIDQLDGETVSHDQSDIPSCPNVQTT